MKALIAGILICALNVGSFYAGIRVEQYADFWRERTALRGCEMVASQVLKDAIEAEGKFKACSDIFENVNKAFAE